MLQLLKKPAKSQPLEPIVLSQWGKAELAKYLPVERCGKLLAVDYETTGLDPLEDKVVGVGIADELYPQGVYFCLKERESSLELAQRIAKRPKIAHNFQFELIMEEMHWQRHTCYMHKQFSQSNWKYCTQGLLNQIEGDYAGGYTEGERNTKLKRMQVDILGWNTKGDVELDKWLTDHGYVDDKGKVLKGEMHRAPTRILGHYCGLDAQSTWLLYTNFYLPALRDFPELEIYHSRDYMNLGVLEAEERLRGFQVNRGDLEYYIENLKWIAETLAYEFIHYSPATPHIKRFNDAVVDKLSENMPKPFTKAGAVSKNWEKKQAKIAAAKGQNHFKITSKTKDLPWVLYDCLYSVRKYSEVNWRGETKYKMDIDLGDETVTVDCESEKHRPVTLEVLPRLGEAGDILTKYSKTVKELGYCEKCLTRVKAGDILYPQLRLSGTKTDRCAGTGGFNIQQQTKTYDYMKCFTHRPGHTLIQMDIDALEAVVLAELSECKAYNSLYGPDAQPGNDVYLFVGSGLGAMAEPILRDGYDPTNIDPAKVKLVKKQHKGLRAIFKKFHLSGQYGAGAYRIWRDLILAEIYVTLEQCKEMHENYWKLFEDVVKYIERLKDERVANDGYFLDGLGCPVTVDERCIKDILNRCIQNTGHKILVKYLYHLQQLRSKTSVKFWPILTDLHDESIWECRIEDAEEVKRIFNKAWKLTNEELGGTIKLTGEPEICKDWTFFKCEEPRGIL